MSSTINTSRPLMSAVRSLRIRTTPELFVPEPYDEIAIQSTLQCDFIARVRSLITIIAPFRTPTIRGSLPA